MTIDEMKIKLAEMKEPLDIPGDLTQRQRDEYEGWRSWYRAHIQDVTDNQEKLAQYEPKIAFDSGWLEDLTGIRQVLCAEYGALPRGDKREQNYVLSIKCIDRGVRVLDDTGYMLSMTRLGALMLDSGYRPSPSIEGQVDLQWFGSEKETRRRLAELTRLRDDAQIRLDNALRDPVPA